MKPQLYNDYKTHVQKRIRYRFGIDLPGDIVMNTLRSTINQGVYIKDSIKHRKVYLVRAFKKRMLIVYDTKHSLPITVMVPNGS